MYVRHPVWLTRVRTTGAEAFAVLFTIESLSRAVLATVIPLQALALLGNAQKVSLLFFAVSIAGLCGSFTVPWLIRRTRRRWVYSMGAVLLVAASALLANATLVGQVAGMVLRVYGVVALSICLNLYIMEHIDRRDLNRSEPLRIFYSAGAWTAGPVLGVYLGNALSPWAPYAVSAAGAAALRAYFWFLRMTESLALVRNHGPTPSPISNIRRYFAQPRLTLAWALAMGRNAWWVMFFIYTPIYAVTSGLGEIAGGLIVSAGTGFLFLMPLMGWCARRFGLRRVFVFGFATGGVLTLPVSLTAGAPWLGAALLVCAAVSMITIDAGGNILFMRAVRPRERPEMTTVFSTYRDFAELAPPGAFSLLLKFFELPAVFATTGAAMLGLAWLSRHINHRM